MVVYGSEERLPPGTYLGDCAVSGGTLAHYLRQALALYGKNLCIRIAPVYMDFPQPCPGGSGRPLTEPELEALRREEPCFYSPALGTEYFTCLRQGQAHAVLFDSLDSLKKKLDLCREVGVSMVLIEDPELRRRLGG